MGYKQGERGYSEKHSRVNIICGRKRQQRTVDGKMGLEIASDIYRDRWGKVQQTRLVATSHRIRKVTDMMEWRAEEEIIGMKGHGNKSTITV